MRVLIPFASKYGTVAEVAERIAGDLRQEVETRVVHLRRQPSPAVGGFDVVLIGGSIYGGRIQREVTQFCERHRDALLSTQVGLFMACLYHGSKAEAQLAEAFPSWLLAHAFGAYHVGGRVNQSRLGFWDRLLVRRISGVRGDFDALRDQTIRQISRDTLRRAGAAR